MDCNGKVALITGGARIGATVAEAIAQRGARVALTWRHSQQAARTTLQEIQRVGGEAALFRVDLAGARAAKPLVKDVVDRFGRLDILVNMASLYEPLTFSKGSLDDWEKNLNVTLRSAYLLARAAAPFMKKQGAGRIVNFSDWTAASHRPRYRDYLPYYVSKSGVVGLTEALALELAPDILVNAIAPGPILPPQGISVRESRQVKQATPLARWGGAEEIAKAVLFLLDTDFVTGECIRVDGGRHLF